MKPITEMKSYSKSGAVVAGLLLAGFAALILTACGGDSQRRAYNTAEEAVKGCHTFLGELRKKEKANTDDLATLVCEWQTVRDSAIAAIARDTLHHSMRGVQKMIGDSVRIEFCRLAVSAPRTFKDVVTLRDRTSADKDDQELRCARDTISVRQKNHCGTPEYKLQRGALIARYQSFLTATLKAGIHSADDLLVFIGEEDRLFRSLLADLPSFVGLDLSAITRDTEECCTEIIKSAGRGEITYEDAMIHIAMRTDRRLLLNAQACISDVAAGKVRTSEQAQAYLYMLFQPFVMIDNFGFACLTAEQKAQFYKVAEDMPRTLTKLNLLLKADKERLAQVPALFMKIYLTTL